MTYNLYKKLDDWDWVKELDYKTLEHQFKWEYPEYKFKTKPYKHQLAATIIGLANRNFLYFLDLGAGKTKIILDLFGIYKKLEIVNTALILVPNVNSVDVWRQQIDLHSVMSYYELHQQNRNCFEGINRDIFIINYQALPSSFLCGRVKRAGKTEWVPDLDKILKFASKFDFICFDESHMMKNFRSTTFAICKALAENMKCVYGLTGTPFGRDLHDLWGQFKIIDGGGTLGKYVTHFRKTYFKTKVNHWGAYEYTFKSKLNGVLKERIKNKSIIYQENELTDLPKLTKIKIPIRFSVEMSKMYSEVVEEVINNKKDFKIIKNVFVRLRQICSGFVAFKNMDDERLLVDLDKNPKLDALFGLIERLPADSKAIIFNDFVKSGDMICERADQLKLKYVRLYGGTKDKRKVKEEFINNPKIKFIVLNVKSGSVSLNLQAANYVIFYESPISSIDRRQAEKRAHRSGQTKPVFLYDLFIENSIETKILDYLKEGKDLFQAIMRGEETLAK